MSDITIAVSTFRESYLDWVLQLLNSLKEQTFRNFDVLLVVNRNHRYFKLLKNKLSNENYGFEVHVLFNQVDNGIANARNLAIKNTAAPFIAYTDDDAIPQADWLRTILSTFNDNPSAGAVTGPVKAKWLSNTRLFGSWFPEELYWVIGCTNRQFTSVQEVRNGFASNLALDRQIALKCGGFNEAFGYQQKYRMAGEEPEFSLRLRRLGKSTLWNPQLIVYHRIFPSRLKLANITIRSYVEGRTKAHLRKLYGNASTSTEMQQMQTVLEGFFKTGSFRSKTYLAASTSAVAAGYFITVANIHTKRVPTPISSKIENTPLNLNWNAEFSVLTRKKDPNEILVQE